MKIFPWLAPTLIPVNWAFSWHPAVLFDVHLICTDVPSTQPQTSHQMVGFSFHPWLNSAAIKWVRES